MKFHITHESHYRYSAEVFLEPHYLRFQPKSTPHHRLLNFHLEVSPTPAGSSKFYDPENNPVYGYWFEDLHQELSIKATSEVEVEEYNPFNFLIYPDQYLKVPYTYDKELSTLLHPYLIPIEASGSVKDYGSEILSRVNKDTVQFVTELTEKIYREFEVSYRHTGAPYKPSKTLNKVNGSCRDLTWMQINILRQHGIAARFVSGYYYLEMDEPEYELHAWLEAYFPGAGWIGFDPTHGLLTAHTHIPVAASSIYQYTMPVIGTVRGSAGSEFDSILEIQIVS